MERKFPPGQVVSTPGALDALSRAGQDVFFSSATSICSSDTSTSNSSSHLSVSPKEHFLGVPFWHDQRQPVRGLHIAHVVFIFLFPRFDWVAGSFFVSPEGHHRHPVVVARE